MRSTRFHAGADKKPFKPSNCHKYVVEGWNMTENQKEPKLAAQTTRVQIPAGAQS